VSDRTETGILTETLFNSAVYDTIKYDENLSTLVEELASKGIVLVPLNTTWSEYRITEVVEALVSTLKDNE
jgi:hypothetical protein